MKKTSIIIFTILCAFIMTAQRQSTDNLNGWFMYFGDHKLSDKWGLHIEAQWRRADIISTGQQLLLRPGINYYFNPNVKATVGYCFVETYPYGEFPVKATYPEHRLWEQIQIKNQVSNFEMVNRFRLEQRFSQLPVNITGIWEPDTAVYTNRMRILNRVSIPFKGSKIEDKSLYLSVYDEVFINFGDHVGMNLLDQNRAYIALGYKVPKIGRVELGYLQQTIIKSSGLQVEYNHTIQVSLQSNLDLFKKKS